MASIDFDALKRPLSADDACGPDLDIEYDDDYMNFVANIEGLLPTTFFSEGQPFAFDPAIIKVDNEVDHAVKLLDRTRDLRLVALLGRMRMLARDIHDFARAMDTIAVLLDTFWNDVHPRAEDGAYAMRAATIGTLNETTIIFSLQYAPLCDSRRAGPVTFRSYLYAIHEVEPRKGEESPAESAILSALREAQDLTLAARKSLELLRDAINRIGAIWMDRADFLTAPKLSNVLALVERMLGLIDLAFPPETGATGSAPGETGVAAAAISGSVGSAADAVAAINAVTDYFVMREPSSPVLPLVAQARQLLGKSFVEVLQTLLPNHVGSAAYQIGGRQFFPLPVESLSSLLPTPHEYGGAAVDEAPAESDTSWSSWDNSAEETPAESSTEGGDGETAADGGAEESVAAPVEEPVAKPPPPPARSNAPRTYSAATRAEALGLLDQVAAWLRVSEPSSPVPWLIERARALADRDFLTVLQSVLPSGTLTEIE